MRDVARDLMNSKTSGLRSTAVIKRERERGMLLSSIMSLCQIVSLQKADVTPLIYFLSHVPPSTIGGLY